MMDAKKKQPPSFTQTKGFVFLFIALFLCIGIYNFVTTRMYSYAQVTLGGEQFRARVADTVYKRTHGLGGTSVLVGHDAMLFVFPVKDRYSFWMKDVSYPIDIVWFADGKIIDVASRVPPVPTDVSISLPTYKPRLAADRVVELPSGTAERLQLKIGDPISEIAD
ncbi:MAG: DUF192 domain-containing protein [Candidatus Magasanikbacteria bacterium]|nr:DUF192 domain-containing protein [Candidatus Magasanikbacteria bacterium]